jgi:hypothetical protein
MSADEYAAISTERLLGLFAEAANRGGLARQFLGTIDSVRASVLPEKRELTPERMRSAAEVRALGEALRARGPIAEARRLFEDDDPDVRMCAALHFPHLDPELASAAISAVYARIPTREVFALRLGRLLPLLASPNVTVRREAATACLRVAEQDSIPVLEEVAATGGFDDGIPTREALDSWRKNGSVVYGV